MDNELSKKLYKYFEDLDIQFQLVPPHKHCRNFAEKVVWKFKNNFIAILCTMEPLLNFYLWEHLLLQVTMTINMLRQ